MKWFKVLVMKASHSVAWTRTPARTADEAKRDVQRRLAEDMGFLDRINKRCDADPSGDSEMVVLGVEEVKGESHARSQSNDGAEEGD